MSRTDKKEYSKPKRREGKKPCGDGCMCKTCYYQDGQWMCST